MKRAFVILSLIMLISSSSYSQFTLEIEISGLRNDDGKIMLQVYDEKENVIKQETVVIKNNSSSIAIKNLKPGKYAVSYYHDENLDQVMETNHFGKPTEGYGFSNNVTEKSGPPPFVKWLFEVDGNKKILLKPTY